MKKLNQVIIEVNKMIHYMFENKIFLIHIGITIIVMSIAIMSNLNATHLAILILTVSSSLRASINYSLAKDKERKLSVGTVLLFNALSATVIGYIIFMQINHLSFLILYERIRGSENNIYLLSLVISVLISIFAKLIFKKGEPLYGGIISGHATYCATVYILSANQHPAFLFILLIPMITILQSRYSKSKCKIVPALALNILSISLMMYLAKNIIILLAQILLIPLLIGTKSSTPVHIKKEIFFGIVNGVISTISILLIFHKLYIFF